MFRGRSGSSDSRTARSGAHLGPLERRVLEWLWVHEDSASVRDLLPDFPDAAYTTVMTTLERLHRKGLLDRTRHGRAFRYRPSCSRDDLTSAEVRHSIERVLDSGPGGWRPVLSTFVDTVGDRDREALDELERLIRERRQLDGRKDGAT